MELLRRVNIKSISYLFRLLARKGATVLTDALYRPSDAMIIAVSCEAFGGLVEGLMFLTAFIMQICLGLHNAKLQALLL